MERGMHGKTNSPIMQTLLIVKLQIWDIYEGGSLFTGQDPEYEKYRSRAHLAEMINLLGPPPTSLLTKGELRDKFFSSGGKQFLILQYLVNYGIQIH